MAKAFRYRNTLTTYQVPELTDKDVVYLTSKVDEIIDDIEDRVKEIIDLLDNIEGLTEIDEIKEKVGSLVDELY